VRRQYGVAKSAFHAHRAQGAFQHAQHFLVALFDIRALERTQHLGRAGDLRRWQRFNIGDALGTGGG